MEMLVFFWVLCGIAAGIALANKGRSGCGGFLLGLLLGPIGLVIALVMKGDQAALEAQDLNAGKARRCHACAEVVRLEAVKCKHCGADLPPMDPEDMELIARKSNVETYVLIGVVTFVVLIVLSNIGS